MASDKKWIAAGIAGVIGSFIFVGVAAVLLLRYVPILTLSETIGTTDGQDEWAEEGEAAAEEQREAAAEAARLDLDRRYETKYLFDYTRHYLYHDQLFEDVERRLAQKLSECDSPLEFHRYSEHIDEIGNFYHYDGDPAKLLSVLDTWVQKRPDSYHALMIRGKFRERYAWYFRGGGYAGEISGESWDGYREQIREARADLEAAYRMNPADPEISAELVEVLLQSGGDSPESQTYYNATLKLCPTHYRVRFTQLNYAQPQWGGSWGEMEAIADEAVQASSDFPLLKLIPYYTAQMMYDRDEDHRQAWDSRQLYHDALAAYDEQLAHDPEDVHLMASAAYYATLAMRAEPATNWFRKIGDVFPAGSAFSNVAQYNEYRAQAYAMRSANSKIRGTEEEAALLKEAHALHPDEPLVNYLFGDYYVRQEQTEKARAHLEKADQETQGVWLAWAWLHYLEGDHEAAREWVGRYLAESQGGTGLDSARELQEKLNSEA